MKRLYKTLEPIESKPARLVASAVLAVIVMTFINGFIGGMGGIPAFIAFFAVFYSLRVLVGARDRIEFREGLSDGGIVGRMMAFYGAGYLLLWSLLRLGLTFSRVTGWGNINRGGALASVRELFAVSGLERWVYLFAGILMFAFVMSLFPLVVIRKQNLWVVYALVDGAGFAAVCSVIGTVARINPAGGLFEREATLVDCLLVSGRHGIWHELLCLVSVLLFLSAVIASCFLFARFCYRTQKLLTEDETNLFRSSVRALRGMQPRQLRRSAALFLCSAAAIGIVGAVVLTAPEDHARQYRMVAEFLTKDARLGPMEYRGRLYLPVEEELSLYLSGTPKGYLAEKGEDCDSRLYELTIANILYQDTSGETAHLQVYGERIESFAPVSELEKAAAWQTDTAFVLWDEEWTEESAYSHELTGYTVCDKGFVEALEEKFGEVDYRPEDFDDYDAYFSLYSYPEIDAVLTRDPEQGHWIGCILVYENRFYYGSRDNEIRGALLEELLDILGGY